MKRLLSYLLLVLVLTFNLQSWTKADDIRHLEIEGMSIGDSLLDYANTIGFSIEEIKKMKFAYYPKSKKFVGLSIPDQGNYKVYESVQFHIDPNDYKIYSISGKIKKPFENNKAKCYNKMDLVFNELNDSFSNLEIKKGKEKAHVADNTGKSLSKVYNLKLENGSIRITCTDWSGDFKDSNGRILKDNFKISIVSELLSDWIKNEAY